MVGGLLLNSFYLACPTPYFPPDYALVGLVLGLGLLGRVGLLGLGFRLGLLLQRGLSNKRIVDRSKVHVK